MRDLSPREQQLVHPQGDLHLVERAPLTAGTTLLEVPGAWTPRLDGRTGARVRLDGDGLGELAGHGATGSDVIAVDAGEVLRLDARRTVRVSAEPDGQQWVEVFDSETARARSFAGIEHYAFAPEWVVDARFVPDTGTVSFTRTGDGDREFSMATPGSLDVRYGSETVRLALGSFGPWSVLSFRDTTSAEDSHGAGRMIWLQGDLRELSTLDFNEAILPPCAFNPIVSCPIPPAGNMLPVAVRAGERRASFGSDYATT